MRKPVRPFECERPTANDDGTPERSLLDEVKHAIDVLEGAHGHDARVPPTFEEGRPRACTRREEKFVVGHATALRQTHLVPRRVDAGRTCEHSMDPQFLVERWRNS